MAAGLWSDMRGANLLDSGASFYDTYETADARHVAVGCLEPLFFAEFARLPPTGHCGRRCAPPLSIESGRRHGTTGTVSLLRPMLVLHRFCPCGKPGIIPTIALATPL